MVMATPFLISLRQSLDGEMWGTGKPSAIQLYNGLDLFDRFLPYNGKNNITYLDLISELRRIGFLQGIALPHSFRSALMFCLGKVKQRIGYGMNGRSILLNKVVEAPGEGIVPTVEHYLRILDALSVPRVCDKPQIKVTEDEDLLFDGSYHDIERGFIVFIAGAQYGPSKRWPDTHFSALADLLIERFNKPILILPGKGEEDIAGRIRNGAKHGDKVFIKDLGMRELKSALARASLVVANDTGPRHIAAALAVPTIVILGPMDDAYTRYPSSNTYSISNDLPCRPCNKKTCDRDHECLKGIEPITVFKKAEEVLGELYP
jgi:heptosyltransferase II